MLFPQHYEEALWSAARRQLGERALESAALRRAILDRARRYTSEREQLDDELSGMPGRLDVAARAVFYTPTDAIKALVALRELSRRDALPSGDVVRVVDVGAGVGAMTLAIAVAVGHERVRATAIDRDAAAQRVFSDCAEQLGISVDVVNRNVVDCDFGSGEVDLAIAGGVLNELPETEALRVVERMLSAIAPNGSVIVVEPALRDTSRALHRIRDSVLSASLAAVFAPCTRSCAPCPALADERDWCHEDRRLELPRRANQLAKATGLRDTGLKFSYLVLRKQPVSQVAIPADRVALRVVSQPRKTKGKLECYVCGEAGRHQLRLLNRNKSAANKPLTRARRGDVVLVAPDMEPVVPKDAGVELVRLPVDHGEAGA